MEAILAGLETSGKVATIKSIAYELGKPIFVVEALVRSALQSSSQNFQAIWGRQIEGRVVLTSDSSIRNASSNEYDGSAVLVAIYAKSENEKGSMIVINDQLDGLRESLQSKSNAGFFLNSLGPVIVDNLQFALHPTLSTFSSVVSTTSKEEELPKSKTTSKTAADFFRGPSPAAGSKFNKEPSLTLKKDFFSSKKTEPEPAEEVPIKQTTLPAKVVTAETTVQDLDISSSSSSSEEDEEGEDENEEGLDTIAVEAAVSADGKSKKEQRKTTTGSKKKRARIILSDDEDDEKSAAKAESRRIRSEQRRAERELQKQQEQEMKLRREAENREEAKSGFLKQLGASAPSSGTMKKKVLKTRTFIDEEGFEVTEDVLEEVEVPIDETSSNPEESTVPDKKAADVIAMTSSSLPKSATLETSNKKPSRSPPAAKSGGGKQASLTSFFSKKPKD